MWYEKGENLTVSDSRLKIGEVDAEKLALRYGTPLYVYNGDRIVEKYKLLKSLLENHWDRDVRIFYIAAANSSLAIMKILALTGAHASVSHPYQARLAIDAGFKPQNILYTGPQTNDEDLERLIKQGIMISVESNSQIEKISKFGKQKISIKYSPDNSSLHGHTKELKNGHVKGGFTSENVINAFNYAKKNGLIPVGLQYDMDYELRVQDVDHFFPIVDKISDVAKRAGGILGRELDFVVFGGGPNIPYTSKEKEFPIEKFTHAICKKIKDSGLTTGSIGIETGSYLVGDAGVFFTKIISVGEKEKRVVGVDCGHYSVPGPINRGAWNEMIQCTKADKQSEELWFVLGNNTETESSPERKLNPVKLHDPVIGEMLAIINSGSYGFSKTSRFNSMPLPGEALVMKGRDMLIRKREVYGDLLRGQIV